MNEMDKEDIQRLQWRMDIVVRAWDPNLTPQSEFRGIVWDGALTCLCQYFHPLVFEELFKLKQMIQADILQSKTHDNSSAFTNRRYCVSPIRYAQCSVIRD